jgi:hypothetical protein
VKAATYAEFVLWFHSRTWPSDVVARIRSLDDGAITELGNAEEAVAKAEAVRGSYFIEVMKPSSNRPGRFVTLDALLVKI